MAQGTQRFHIFIDHLLEEKDRLINEKDELVDSKNKLWRAMHQQILERDARIAELERAGPSTGFQEEGRKLGERNRALEDAPRDLLDREHEAEVEEEEQEDARDDVKELGSAVYVVLQSTG